MSDAAMSERQERERTYYDSYAERVTDLPSFEPISGRETRPWNPYWRLFELVAAHYRPGATLLDFGCGWGTNTVVFAKIGYAVEGFDISSKNIEHTRSLAATYGLADKVHAQIEAAESLSYSDGQFDVVVGVDILHHVDIDAAIREVHRVLKPGGVAIFREPVEQPIFDWLRNTALVKRLKPNSKSLDNHITEDERKLTRAELAKVLRAFPSHRIESFRMLSRLDALSPSLIAPLEKLDRHLAVIPGFTWWRGTTLLVLRRT
jgi:2-polyprenyl-3-methyl-5-hydroxy-6-metoxy-1,4-benzoquinol methylase